MKYSEEQKKKIRDIFVAKYPEYNSQSLFRPPQSKLKKPKISSYRDKYKL